jgi:hypothetical protein
MLEVFQALLTPTIAVVTAYIAYQQYRIRRDERSLALYDRRLALFKTAIEAVDRIRSGKEMSTDKALAWLSSVAEAQFVFGEEVQLVVEPLFEALYGFAIESEMSKREGRRSVACATAALKVEEFRAPLMAVLMPYLRPAGSPNKRKARLSPSAVNAMLPRSMEQEATDEKIPF